MQPISVQFEGLLSLAWHPEGATGQAEPFSVSVCKHFLSDWSDQQVHSTTGPSLAGHVVLISWTAVSGS